MSAASSIAADQLQAFVSRIENLEGEKKALSDDIRDVYSEAKSFGLDVKIIRKIITLRKMDHEKRQHEQAILDLYLNALGMLSDLPLGQAAVAREFGVRAS